MFDAEGRAWCAVTLPNHALGDAQVTAEYLVYGIRALHSRAHRRISVLGHGLGGVAPRWALRFWPDLRPMLDDVIGLAPDNHGSTQIRECVEGVTTCHPVMWQHRDESNFLRALNSRQETFAGISYTNVYTVHDEIVTPPATSVSLSGGGGTITNVALQDVCPLDPSEHALLGTMSATTYGIVMDALSHAGSAVPARVDRAVCTQPFMPGVDPSSASMWLSIAQVTPYFVGGLAPYVSITGSPMAAAEPELRCYVYAHGCHSS